MAIDSKKWVITGLFACGFLFVFTETLLSPFYPQFFANVFNIENVAITGYYMAACRITVMICAPLWGLLARRWDPIVLLITSQTGAAVLTAVLSFSQNVEQFFLFSVLLLMFKSSYLLFYTVLIGFQQQKQEAVGQAVGGVHLILHTAMILSTILSSLVITTDDPLSLFIFASILDLVQVAICLYILRSKTYKNQKEKAVVQQKQVSSSSSKASESLKRWGTLLVTVFCFHLAINLVRPFFTKYVMSDDSLALNSIWSGVAYLLPSLMAFAVFPFIRKLCSDTAIARTFAISSSILIASLYAQAIVTDSTMLMLARASYGIALVLTTACLDIRIFTFRQDSNLHFNYGLAVAVQNLSLLLAPLIASTVVSQWFITAPFYIAMAVFVVGWFIGIKKLFFVNGEAISESDESKDNEIIKSV